MQDIYVYLRGRGTLVTWSAYMSFNNRNLKLPFFATRCLYHGGAFQPYKLPILTSQLHLAETATTKYGVTPYLIFRNQWDIQHFLFFLTFSYHWEILYEPRCQWCWVKFTYAGHVMLQEIFYKLWSKTLLQAFQPYTFPILTSQLHLAWRSTPKFGVTPLSYL